MIGAVGVGGALLFAAAVFVWRVVFDDAPWTIPRLPRVDHFGAFGIYSWIPPLCAVAVAEILVVSALRRRGRSIAPSLWLRFADPRKGGALTRAISVDGHWTSGYSWLDANDLRALRVWVDDPAVIDCDSRVRPERVAPAPWHKLGVEW